MNNKFKIMQISTTRWLVLSIFLSLALLAGALFFEHVMKLAPCQMCYWQRDALKIVILVAGFALLIKHFAKSEKWDRLLLCLLAFAFLGSFAMAFWHMGVEYKWWLGPKSCAALNPTEINPDAIFEALNGGGKLPQCSDAPWDLFGISMAGYNAVISGTATLASFMRALKGSGHDATAR